jgi:hypothetical protein
LGREFRVPGSEVAVNEHEPAASNKIIHLVFIISLQLN